jgi:Flp pilus assembly CpaE family ATPase
MLTQEFPAVRNAQHYLAALARVGYGQDAVKMIVNRYEKRASLHVNMDQLQQTLGAAPFWGFPNRYDEAMKAVHEARPVVMRGNTDLARSYREFAKKAGITDKPAAAKPA